MTCVVVRTVVSKPRVEISALCEVHGVSGLLTTQREGGRIMLAARADRCCAITLPGGPVIWLLDVLGEWLG